MGAADFFGEGGTTFLRDTWKTATFAAARRARRALRRRHLA